MNQLVRRTCLRYKSASIETEEEYIHVKRRIESILEFEKNFLETPESTHVIIGKRMCVTLFKG